MISASCVPRKLKNLDDIFHHNKDDYTDCVKMEVKVNKLKPEEIFKTDKEEVRKSNSSQKVGKLKLEANIFENQNSGETPSKSPEIRVGKIDAENIFLTRTPEEDQKEENRNSLKVGKLDRNVYNPSPAGDERAGLSSEVKVGKLTADDLFRPAEEASRELLSFCKPGKLSGDQLRISSNIGKTPSPTSEIFLDFNQNISGCEEAESSEGQDTAVVPPGKVSQLSTELESPTRSQPASLRRSESNLTADMQKKYQSQVSKNESLRREKSDVVVVVTSTGKVSDARSSFFQSMMTNTSSSSSSSSSARLGTSILPAGRK